MTAADRVRYERYRADPEWVDARRTVDRLRYRREREAAGQEPRRKGRDSDYPEWYRAMDRERWHRRKELEREAAQGRRAA